MDKQNLVLVLDLAGCGERKRSGEREKERDGCTERERLRRWW